jgi:hypothetical protein
MVRCKQTARKRTDQKPDDTRKKHDETRKRSLLLPREHWWKRLDNQLHLERQRHGVTSRLSTSSPPSPAFCPTSPPPSPTICPASPSSPKNQSGMTSSCFSDPLVVGNIVVIPSSISTSRLLNDVSPKKNDDLMSANNVATMDSHTSETAISAEA